MNRSSQKQMIYPQVLVVGMSRTGTDSMKQALELLYDRPSYHMSVVLNQPGHFKFWSDLAFGCVSPETADWQNIFRGYAATTDLPSAHYFDYLVRAFPDAKVVLSLRDEQEWLASYLRLMKAIHRFRLVRFLPPLNRLWPFGTQMSKLIFGENYIDEQGFNHAALLEGYRKHNDRVRQIVPAERLLEFNVGQGWDPLCKFLDVEIPSVPFPHSNAGVGGPTRIVADALTRLSFLPILLIVGGLLLIAVFLLS